MFQGPAALTLDGKGRIAMPARHRALLEAVGTSQLTITKFTGPSLLIFPKPAWENFRARVAALPQDAAAWKRLLLGNAMEADIDASSRVLIAPELRGFAGLTRDVVLLGMGGHFELWDAERLAAAEAAVLASPMPESLKSFAF